MNFSKKIRVFIFVVFLIVVAVVWYLFNQKNTELTVLSEDGNAKLFIDEDNFPKGVDPKKISITKLSDAELAKIAPKDKKQKVEQPLAVYRLEPDGTQFNKPVKLEVVVSSSEKNSFLPNMYSVGKDKLEAIKASAERLADGNIKVTGEILHFSDVVFGLGFFALDMPKNLGHHYVGETFTAMVNLAIRDNYSFFDSKGNVLSVTLESDPEFYQDGDFKDLSVPPILTPNRVDESPEAGTVIKRNQVTFRAEFTCARSGYTLVSYGAVLLFKSAYDDGSLIDYILGWPDWDAKGLFATGQVTCVEPPPEPPTNNESTTPTVSDPGPKVSETEKKVQTEPQPKPTKVKDQNPAPPVEEPVKDTTKDDQASVPKEQPPANNDICCYNPNAKLGEKYYIPFDGSGCMSGFQQVPLDKNCANPLPY